MKIDTYTKVVLTAIAFGLFLNISVSVIHTANALGYGDEITVNHKEDISVHGCNLNIVLDNLEVWL